MVNVLLGIITLILFNCVENNKSTIANYESSELHISNDLSEYTKEKAYQILNNKCNVCHIKRNKGKIFTKENMDTWANDTYKKVFM